MKTALFSLGALALLAFIVYIAMAVMSQKTPDTLGLVHEQLRPCPESPNCVCSEIHTENDEEHYIEPIYGKADTWKRLKVVIKQQGGEVTVDTGDYIHATFSSSIFHYVDDVEFLSLGPGNEIIHIRSASRIGRNDFGINRARVEKFKQAL